MPQIGVVEEYWTGVASQLQVEAEVFSRLVGHNGEMGRANEIALAQLVERLVPSRFGVGTGIVFDKHGGRSKQCDLIIFDQSSQPQLLAQSTQLLFPVETVRMVIEIKTTITASAIDDAGEKARSVRALQPAHDGPSPAFGLFGYQASGAPSVRAAEINQLPIDSRPDLTCVLVPGLATSLNDPTVVGLVPLHATGHDGERVGATWIPQEGSDAWVARGATRYPVSRFSVAAQRHVFEPGRALLIFAKCLLDQLDPSTGSASSWLGEYLPEIAREVVVPTTNS